MRNQTKLFEEHQIDKAHKIYILEESNVTTLSIIIDKNTYGDDSDVQVDDKELVCPQICITIFEVQDDMKIKNEDNNDSKSLLELLKDVIKSFVTTHVDFIILQ